MNDFGAHDSAATGASAAAPARPSAPVVPVRPRELTIALAIVCLQAVLAVKWSFGDVIWRIEVLPQAGRPMWYDTSLDAVVRPWIELLVAPVLVICALQSRRGRKDFWAGLVVCEVGLLALALYRTMNPGSFFGVTGPLDHDPTIVLSIVVLLLLLRPASYRWVHRPAAAPVGSADMPAAPVAGPGPVRSMGWYVRNAPRWVTASVLIVFAQSALVLLSLLVAIDKASSPPPPGQVDSQGVMTPSSGFHPTAFVLFVLVVAALTAMVGCAILAWRQFLWAALVVAAVEGLGSVTSIYNFVSSPDSGTPAAVGFFVGSLVPVLAVVGLCLPRSQAWLRGDVLIAGDTGQQAAPRGHHARR